MNIEIFAACKTKQTLNTSKTFFGIASDYMMSTYSKTCLCSNIYHLKFLSITMNSIQIFIDLCSLPESPKLLATGRNSIKKKMIN